MGGSSTQIAFTPKDPMKDPASAAQLRLYGFDYSVYTHSYLCYGKDQAMGQLLAKLIKAFSAYFYTFNFLGLAPQAPLPQVLSTIESFYKKDWAMVRFTVLI
ncbi:hypothetical protein MATL_G00062830 [Megalops atlanticus]|uniref:Ectonucleoside triphosphate diphosphohydrolase 8 n=1 Tax=Megalops atlanticus TaxID=7932 RepID=A0A9D3Q9Q7_MEGAT|nr:hypothetical protein MATL_G00062830 [Megalops atlanticus]